MPSENSTNRLTSAILEYLERRARDNGDAWEPDAQGRIRIRCLRPERHQNGDAHPSALYSPGKYLVCPICGLKLGWRRLAQELGVGEPDVGLTVEALSTAKHLPLATLRELGWRTRRRSGRAEVLLPYYPETGPAVVAHSYHIRHYLGKDDGLGPRWTWDLPRHTGRIPYGVWKLRDWQERARASGVDPYLVVLESEVDAVTLWLHDIPAIGTGGADGWLEA